MQRVLITGGAGYLGSTLAARLLEAGHKVTALDNLLIGSESLFHLAANPNFDFVCGDARDERLMKELIAQSDVIVPLAAIVGAPACERDPWGTLSTNRDAVILSHTLAQKGQLVIYPTTNSGYGTQSGELYCTEETPLEPISLYGKAKVEAEQALLDAGDAITFRLATVFGMSPRMRLDLLVNHFVYAAITDGTIVIFEKDFKRNYVHVRDVADCFLHAIENSSKMVGRAFNVGLDEANLSKAELADKIKEFVPNFYIHYANYGKDPDQRNYIVSNRRLRESGFEAKRGLDDGIRELLKGYRCIGRTPFKNVTELSGRWLGPSQPVTKKEAVVVG